MWFAIFEWVFKRCKQLQNTLYHGYFVKYLLAPKLLFLFLLNRSWFYMSTASAIFIFALVDFLVHLFSSLCISVKRKRGNYFSHICRHLWAYSHKPATSPLSRAGARATFLVFLLSSSTLGPPCQLPNFPSLLSTGAPRAHGCTASLSSPSPYLIPPWRPCQG